MFSPDFVILFDISECFLIYVTHTLFACPIYVTMNNDVIVFIVS